MSSSAITGSYGKSIFSFERTAKYFPGWFYPCTFLPKMYEWPTFSASLSASSLLFILAILVDVRYHCSFNFHFSSGCWILLAFISHPYIFFGEMSVHFSAYYVIRFFFFMLSFESSSYILDAQSLSGMWFKNIVSQSVMGLFAYFF